MNPDCFAVGDVVRIREWEDMESEFGLTGGTHINCTCFFVHSMRESCGELCTVLAKDGKRIDLAFEDPRINAKMRGWGFSTDMIEPAGCDDRRPAGYSDINQEAVLSLSDFLSGM